MIVLALSLGLLLFLVARSLWGDVPALLALLLYLLSPFTLAHGRLVTLDVPTALGSFSALCLLIPLVDRPSRLAVLLCGVGIGLVFLIKFSLITLVPFMALVMALWSWLRSTHWPRFAANLGTGTLRLLAVLAIAACVISAALEFTLWDYPKAQHVQDISEVLTKQRLSTYSKLAWLPALAQFGPTRPLAQYLYGMSWQFARTGAFSYFDGEGSLTSWRSYYPAG